MLNQQIQDFIGKLADNSELSFNEAWDILSGAILELTYRPDDLNNEAAKLIDKFIRLPVVINVLQDLVLGKCCPPDSQDEAREKAWKFYDYVPSKTCKEIVYDWNIYLNNVNGEN